MNVSANTVGGSRADFTEDEIAKLRAALHTLGNVASVCASSARLLPRFCEDQAALGICDGLSENADIVRATMEDLKAVLRLDSLQ
ncbi:MULTISPECIES: hypothetical protein [Thioclava]|uniref:Uncharacterized protein n=1 Tax=Thioclava electrotropha TaxID=1549850 RepID=A0ABX6YST5_9RHOB|nr:MULTISPECIES: hypothetical protein [Thioclava]MAQ38887.1 hypothetical protein [Thioclava sp.]MPQ93447.1 hypothetical protein [Thioclava sp. JE_KL1]OOY06068.1 hypothetical protein BMI87_00715 [Thioclava sp. F28-4]OOY09584.1 hypothetical protein BMI89_07205 [Thioclava sp. F36-7]OOY17548.1 hypothetical protein BMI85_00865 [Thioclava sp. DLFJ4-1]|tara:strand:+ start:408 stop:662 length:255 start_codon:yes stop_codon:yes gene_type:complete